MPEPNETMGNAPSLQQPTSAGRQAALNDLEETLSELVEAEMEAEAGLCYEVVSDKKFPNEWRVEAIDSHGDCFIAMFSGPEAESRAREYGAFKSRPTSAGTKLTAEEFWPKWVANPGCTWEEVIDEWRATQTNKLAVPDWNQLVTLKFAEAFHAAASAEERK